MKGITLLQPWASFLILGVRCQARRTWETGHRGELAVHASRRFAEETREWCRAGPWRRSLQKAGYASWCDLPAGALLGTIELVDCLPVESVHDLEDSLPVFGERGRWVWVFRRPRPLARPLPWKGQRGLYEIPAHLFEPSRLAHPG